MARRARLARSVAVWSLADVRAAITAGLRDLAQTTAALLVASEVSDPSPPLEWLEVWAIWSAIQRRAS